VSEREHDYDDLLWSESADLVALMDELDDAEFDHPSLCDGWRVRDLWHESMPGFEGTYHGRDEAMTLLGRVLAETGMEVVDMAVEHVLAHDTHATVVLETTVGIGDRRHHGRYVDVYRLRDGTAIEHWHLPFDPSAEAAFFGG
jgi:hypothetical protein